MDLWIDDREDGIPAWSIGKRGVKFVEGEPFCIGAINYLRDTRKDCMIVLSPAECAELNEIAGKFFGFRADMFLDAMMAKAILIILDSEGKSIPPPIIVTTAEDPNIPLEKAGPGRTTVGIRYKDNE